SYFLTSILLYNQKRFFNDKPINLSIFTVVFSMIFSIFNILLFFIFDKKLALSLKWLVSDIILFPILDGIYTLILFAIPIWLFEKFMVLGFKNLWIRCKILIFQKSR
ncbi:MAG: hypothetical protein WCT85_06230, partial [Parachlamydiales bacterium]